MEAAQWPWRPARVLACAYLILAASAVPEHSQARVPPTPPPGQRRASPIHEAAAKVGVPKRGGPPVEAPEASQVPNCAEFDKCVAGGEPPEACCPKHLKNASRRCGICLKSGCHLRADFCRAPSKIADPYCTACHLVADAEGGARAPPQAPAVGQKAQPPLGPRGTRPLPKQAPQQPPRPPPPLTTKSPQGDGHFPEWFTVPLKPVPSAGSQGGTPGAKPGAPPGAKPGAPVINTGFKMPSFGGFGKAAVPLGKPGGKPAFPPKPSMPKMKMPSFPTMGRQFGKAGAAAKQKQEV